VFLRRRTGSGWKEHEAERPQTHKTLKKINVKKLWRLFLDFGLETWLFNKRLCLTHYPKVMVPIAHASDDCQPGQGKAGTWKTKSFRLANPLQP
jgi:hypothetical protein